MHVAPARARAALITVAIVESLTWLGLIVGMLFKYVVSDNQAGVHIFGPLHGVAFVAYLVTVLVARSTFRWDLRLTLIALACSIPPFFSLFFELWADRSGRLAPAAATA